MKTKNWTGKVHTRIVTRTESNGTIRTNVIYHRTAVVSFTNLEILLNTGGYYTTTTKRRMNQTSDKFGLGFKVYQKDFKWYVDYAGKTMTFHNNRLTLKK